MKGKNGMEHRRVRNYLPLREAGKRKRQRLNDDGPHAALTAITESGMVACGEARAGLRSARRLLSKRTIVKRSTVQYTGTFYNHYGSSV